MPEKITPCKINHQKSLAKSNEKKVMKIEFFKNV